MRIKWIVCSQKLKIFKNQIRDKVRNAFKKKKAHIMVRELNSKDIIINKHQCKWIYTPLSWWPHQEPHGRTYWKNQSNQFWMPSPTCTLQIITRRHSLLTLKSSININVNACILHSHDNAANNYECHLQQTSCRL